MTSWRSNFRWPRFLKSKPTGIFQSIKLYVKQTSEALTTVTREVRYYDTQLASGFVVIGYFALFKLFGWLLVNGSHLNVKAVCETSKTFAKR